MQVPLEYDDVYRPFVKDSDLVIRAQLHSTILVGDLEHEFMTECAGAASSVPESEWADF